MKLSAQPADIHVMRRTLKLLGLISIATAAGAAAARRALAADPDERQAADPVSQELRHALQRFENRFGS